MSAAAELLRRADEYRALGEEHASENDPARQLYVVVELVLREIAAALERERLEEAA